MKNVFTLFIAISFYAIAYSQNLDWVKEFSINSTVSNGGSAGSRITTDPSGNVYTTGYFYTTTDFDPGPNTFNITPGGYSGSQFISKMDANGNFVWAKEIYCDSINYMQLTQVVHKNGDVYYAGRFKGTIDIDPGPATHNLTSAEQWNLYLGKLDANGNFLWGRQIDRVALNSPDDQGFLTLDTLGNVYITGNYYDTVDFDPGLGNYSLTASINKNAFVCKLDASGNFLWAKDIMGLNGNYTATSLNVSNGNIYLSGSGNNTAGGSLYICKLDSSGNSLWLKFFTGTFINEVLFTTDSASNIYLAGLFAGNVDFDAGTGSYNLYGGTGITDNDLFICKLDPSGNFLFAKQIGNQNCISTCLTVDANSNIYLGGVSYGQNLDVDPSTSIYNLAHYGGFFVKYNSQGNFVWAQSYNNNVSGGGIFQPSDMEVTKSDKVLVTGNYSGIVDFDPGTGTFNLTTATNQSEAFILKLNQAAATTQNEIYSESKLSLFPNPTDGKLIIESEKNLNNAVVRITDLSGKAVTGFSKFNSHSVNIDISHAPKGIYVIELVFNDKSTKHFKVVTK